MRINTNVSALNSQRILGQTSTAVAKNIGKLSSGFRINKASDDAAGLGVANKMRADLRSLRQASRNAEQATSLLQVAEGAAQTISTIVDRMKELATQAGSDTVDDAARGRIKSEFTQLQTEIDKIAATTKFQGNALVNGNFGAKVTAEDFEVNVIASFDVGGAELDTYTLTSSAAGELTLTNSAGSLTQVVSGLSDGAQTASFDKFGINVTTGTGYDADAVDNINEAENAASADFTVGGASAQFLVRSSGAYATDDRITMSAIDLTADTLGLAAGDLTITGNGTAAEWQAVMTATDTAVGLVNTAFGTLGALQNRIAYASQNTATTVENFAAAESVIRDADMAAEMTEFSKNQILQQAGISMLAQANSSSQAILKLLG